MLRNALLAVIFLAPAALAVGSLETPDAGGGPSQETLSKQTLACLTMSDDDCGGTATIKKSMADASGFRVAPEGFGADGAFDRLQKVYPHGDDVEAILALIGHKKDAGWITNTCTIRMSYSLNNSGAKLDPMIVAGLDQTKIIHDASSPSKRSDVYVITVEEFTKYMLRRYGRPQIAHSTSNGENLQQAVLADRQRGIILFAVRGWSDATGHFDLWDGANAEHGAYFDKATDVYIWK
jgi:hypothetical protein